MSDDILVTDEELAAARAAGHVATFDSSGGSVALTGHVAVAVSVPEPLERAAPIEAPTRPLAALEQAVEAPQQEHRDVPADAAYWSDAARLKGEGWAVPLPALDEVIRMREALRIACRQVAARRDSGGSQLPSALRKAADLAADDLAVPLIVAAVEGVALEMWAQANLGVRDSQVSALSYELETMYLRLLHAHQRSILQSLVGRESPAANRLRALVEGMDRQLSPPSIGFNDYVIHP